MQWFRNLSIAQKFVATFALLFVLLGLSLVAILFYLARINSYVERHTRITIPAIVTAADMRQSLYQVETLLRTMLPPRPAAALESFRQLEGLETVIHRAIQVYRGTHAARTHPILFGMLTKHRRVDLAHQEDRTVSEIAALLEEFTSKRSRFQSLLAAGRVPEAEAALSGATEIAHRLMEAATALIDVHTRIDIEMKSEGNLLLRQARLVILALVIVLGCVIAGTYAMVTTQIARPLSRLAQIADRITRRDLSAGFDRWPARDEVGHLTASLSAMLTTLREQTRALERKTKELESFTYSVAHDLKAPLREIEGFSSLLLARPAGDGDHTRTPDPARQRYLQTIHSAALRMSAFIDDLLQYSRLEQLAIPKCRVDVRDMIDAIVSERRPPESAVDARMTVHLPFADVWGEPTSIRQALVNVIDNAVKFSCGANPSEITIGGRAADGQRILWIRDNGIGFDGQDRDRIFNLFEKLHSPQEYEGTGAGLAIVKLIMDKHGGQVWAESSPGKGSTFYLLFPEP